MSTSLRRWRIPTLVSALLAVACGTAKHTEGPTTAESVAGGAHTSSPRSTSPDAPPAATGLYAAEEALRDALSGPWEYLGTGPWHGIGRTQACAFRNGRVVVVNVYCTITDTQAFRVDVYSPRRGRVRIYAEASAPVSAHTRPEYFTFTAESEPPPGPEAGVPPFSLTMSFAELSAYEERRYGAFLPACFGGVELARSRTGCLGPLAPRATEWTNQHRTFLEHASDDWYRLVREMRALAERHGKEPE